MQKIIQTHLTRYQAEFEAQSPFPHLIIDDLWDREFLSEVRLEVENNQAWGGEKKLRRLCFKALVRRLSSFTQKRQEAD